jgi:hypothetical protein
MKYYWYLYTLSDKGKVFYVGMSAYPASRYQQHCTNTACCRAYHYIHWMLERGEYPDMNIVWHFNSRADARFAEEVLVRQFASMGHKLCNTDYNPIYNVLITCIPNTKRKRHKSGYSDFVRDKLKKYQDNERDEFRYNYLGDTASAGR